MGVRVLYDSGENRAALFDSVSETAFGPVFGWGGEDGNGLRSHPIDRAHSFLSWIMVEHEVTDPRAISDKLLAQMYEQWRKKVDPESN